MGAGKAIWPRSVTNHRPFAGTFRWRRSSSTAWASTTRANQGATAQTMTRAGLDQAAKNYMADNPGTNYLAALKVVAALNPGCEVRQQRDLGRAPAP